MNNPFIMIAPNGARKTKEDLAHIPLWAEEIAREAKACAAAGAAAIHLHIRDASQKHTLDVDIYRRTIEALRSSVGDKLIIQATSESVGIYNSAQQMQTMRELKPECCSLAIREIIAEKHQEKPAQEFFHFLAAEKIIPQYILYSPQELEYFVDLQARGIIPKQNNFVLFVLGKKQRVATVGNYAGVDDLNPFTEKYNELGAKLIWAVCAFGGYENEIMIEAMRRGGNARIGFENNHLLADQSIAENNAALVSQLVQTSGANFLSADEVRKVIS